MSIYTRLTPDDIVEANPTVVTTGLWSGDTGSLETSLFLDTSQQIPNAGGEYYFDVYNKIPTDELAEVQFSVSYGHVNGGGSPPLSVDELAKLPTKAIYSQYRNLLLDPSDTKFTFNGVDSDHIYVINFQRARIREQLDPGNWELPLSGANGSFTFIDDSNQTLGALTATSKAGRVFNIVSGALDTVSGSIVHHTAYPSGSSTGKGYGLVYPDLGIIILNPDAIGPLVGFFTGSTGTGTGSAASSSFNTAPFYDSTDFTNYASSTLRPVAPVTQSLSETAWSNGSIKSAYNHAGLFISILLATTASIDFKARSAETISSTHYFIRLRNKEYNYSNNPTFYNPDNGSLINGEFRNDPKVYLTTVGLYNDSNELLAVAKLSQPVRKSFDEEVLLRVRLDF